MVNARPASQPMTALCHPKQAAGFFLDVLMSDRGSNLLRVKGIINIAELPETPMVIHGVQHVIPTQLGFDPFPSRSPTQPPAGYRRYRVVATTASGWAGERDGSRSRRLGMIHAPAYLETWPSEDRDSRLVFIVKDMTKKQIEHLLKVLLDNCPYHEIAKAVPKKRSGQPELG